MLPVSGLHHISLNVTDLERSVAFYQEVVGLQPIERPPFDFPGAWFAVGASGQQLHLIVYAGETLRQGAIQSRDGHFAIRVSSYSATKQWLERCGIPYDARPRPKAGFPQIYILDPDRNIIEFNAETLDEA